MEDKKIDLLISERKQAILDENFKRVYDIDSKLNKEGILLRTTNEGFRYYRTTSNKKG